MTAFRWLFVFWVSASGPAGCAADGGESVEARRGALLAATEEFRTETSDARMNSYIGSLDIDGDTLAVGVQNGLPEGAAHVFVRGAGGWAFQQRLIPVTPLGGERFGASVALSGDLLVVGAPGRDGSAGSDTGAAYLFERAGTAWSELARIESPTAAAGDGFGRAVAIDGDVIAVGAPDAMRAGISRSGDAHVFVRSGATVTHRATLAADDSEEFDSFGQSISVSNPRVVVGSAGTVTLPSTYRPAAAYVFVADATGYAFEAHLSATSSMTGSGSAVALDGDTLVASEPGDMPGGVRRPSLHVYERGAGGWTETGVIYPSGLGSTDAFASTSSELDFEGSRIVAASSNARTAAGAFWIFDRVGVGFVEQLVYRSPTPVDFDGLGSFVRLEGDRVAASAIGTDTAAGTNSGRVFVFTLSAAPDAGVDGGAPDSGAPDAGSALADAGIDASVGADAGPVVTPDASAGSDAGVQADAATPRPDATASTDAGSIARRDRGGCGCRVAPADPDGSHTLLVSLVACLALARARRRRRARVLRGRPRARPA